FQIEKARQAARILLDGELAAEFTPVAGELVGVGGPSCRGRRALLRARSRRERGRRLRVHRISFLGPEGRHFLPAPVIPSVCAESHQYRDDKESDAEIASHLVQMLFAPGLPLEGGGRGRADLPGESIVLALLHGDNDDQAETDQKL